MDIALLNVRIGIQKNEVSVDEIGNHRNVWKDYFSCYATVSGEGGTEKEAVSQTVDHTDCDFTVRYCKETAAVTTDGFRIQFGEELFDIVDIDHRNYKKKSLKFKCRKVRR